MPLVELEARRLISLKPGVTPEALAQSLCDGARGTNQALPPIPIDDLHPRYSQMIEAILFGAAWPPTSQRGRSSRAISELYADGAAPHSWSGAVSQLASQASPKATQLNDFTVRRTL